MEVTQKSRKQLRFDNVIFIMLFLAVIGLLGWLTHHYSLEADWTVGRRNSLSEATVTLLQRIDGPIEITAFARDSELLPVRKQIKEIIGRYQKAKPDIHLSFIDPDAEPDKTRAMNIRSDGELVVDYKGRSEHVQPLNEENLSNSLQRLLRSGERRIVFLTGHGERSFNGQANHDLKQFISQLRDKGIRADSFSFGDNPELPKDISMLVIASPQVDLLPGEVKLLRDYVKKGGNLLWLHDPGSLHGLQPLADDLGVSVVPGTIVDPTTQLLGISDPSFALVAEYEPHPITKNFDLITLYPRACGLESKDKSGWDAARFLRTVPRSWSETGPLKGAIGFDKGTDIPGPLTIGLALSREINDATATANKKNDKAKKTTHSQRVVMVCDGDFLSNAYLGNQGNNKMGENIVNWLSHDDSMIDIPVVEVPGKEITLSTSSYISIAVVFLLLFPIGLVAAGITIWLKRRKA